MAVELLMPRLGWTMEEGVFLQWLKGDGEQVRPGDLLYTIEGDKASSDVESFESGILRIPPDAPAPGTTIPVGTLLGYIVQTGEPAPFEHDHRPPTTDMYRRPLRGGLAPRPPTPTMYRGPSVAASIPDPRPPTPDPRPPAISPRARRVARELGVT